MVDVEQCALRAFKHHVLAVVDGLVEHNGGVGHEGRDLLGCAGILLIHALGIERRGAKERGGDGVLLVARIFDMSPEQVVVQQIDDAEAAAVHLVFIRRADAAAGGADLCAAGSVLGGELDHAVVGQDHLGAVGDEELAPWAAIKVGQAGVFQLPYLVEEGHGIEHDAVPDHALAAGAEYAAGDQLQHELLAVDDDGVPGVVPAGVAGDEVELLGENVDDLALAFVAPLGAEDDGGCFFLGLDGRVRGGAHADVSPVRKMCGEEMSAAKTASLYLFYTARILADSAKCANPTDDVI